MDPAETIDNNSSESTDAQFQYISRTRVMVATAATRSWVEGDPYIRIVEQPNPTLYRFRYKSEGRLAGSIPGINSSDNNKTFPTIEVVNYKGYVEIVVSCVTVEEPYLQHPHNLVSKKGSKYGVYCLQLKGPSMQASLSNVGIRCVRKDGIAQSLKQRKKINVDPFGGGIRNEDYQFNLSAVRLCFQGFIPTGPGTYHKLPPVVSEPITDKKHVYKLEIVGLCSCADKAAGGAQIYMFCSPLSSADVKIRFYEEIDNNIIWESYAEFQKVDIHLKCGIRFKTPPYRNPNIEQPVKVSVQLVRLTTDSSTSAQATTLSEYSQPLPFDYYPDPDRIKLLRLQRSNAGWDRLPRIKPDSMQATVNPVNAFVASNREPCQRLDILSSLGLNLPGAITQIEEHSNETDIYNADDSMESIPSESIAHESGNLWNSEPMQRVMYMWNSQNGRTSEQSTQSTPLHQRDPSSIHAQNQNQKQPLSPQNTAIQQSQLQQVQQPIMNQQHFQSAQQEQFQTIQGYHNTSTQQTSSLSDELEELFNESRQQLQDIEPNCRYSDKDIQTIQQNRNQFSYQQESNHQVPDPLREALPQCKLNYSEKQTLQQPPVHESQQKLPAFQVLKDQYHQYDFFQQSQTLQPQHQFGQELQHPQLHQQLLVQNCQMGQLQHEQTQYNHLNGSNNF